MAQIETWLRCDLQKNVEVVPLNGHLFSADVNGNRIGVIITNRGLPAPVSGTLVCYGIRHDGVTVRAQENITNNNRPSIVLPHDFYTVVGPIEIILRLNSGNDETVLAACSTYVYQTTTDTLIDSGTALPTIESLVEKINACERAANAANEAASSAQSQVNAAATSAANAVSAAQTAQTQASSAASSAADAVASAQAAQTQATNAASSASTATTAAQSAQSDASSAAAAAQTAQAQATNAAASAASAATAAQTAQSTLSNTQTLVAQSNAAAQSAAASALTAANSASDAAANAEQALQQANSANSTVSQLNTTFSAILPTLVNGGEVRGDALYLLHDNEVVAGPFSGFGGGGGGGGGNPSATITFVSTDGNYSYIYSNDQTVTIGLTWSSLEDETPTGSGKLKLTIDGIVKYEKNVAQGNLTENVTSYLRDGDNTLVFQIIDAFGNRRVRSFSVNRVNLQLASSFDDSIDLYGQIEFPYTPYASQEKTMYFLVDGQQVATATVSSYGRQRTQFLPAQEHGAHTLTVYYTCLLDGETVTSNVLHYEITCIESNNDDTIITSPFNRSEVDQYATINVPYRIYNPLSQTSDVVISVNGVAVSTLTGVDRTLHVFSYRLDNSGSTSISIAAGNAVKVILLTVNTVTIDAVAETEGLKLYLSSQGRSNNEANPATWISNQNGTQVACIFTGFNWINNGWVLDDDGITCMRVSGDARIEIPYKPFQTDKRTSGFTIEVDFATRNVLNYDVPIFSCLHSGRGFSLTSQSSELISMGTRLSTKFKENEHVRITYVVEKRAANRLVYCYINGIASAVVQYPERNDMEDFAQIVPQNILIGSNDSTIDIYTIRIYDNDLPMKQVEDNWIADTPDGELMLARFVRNNIRVNDMIRINKLPTDLPYMIITASELPQYKGDKKICSGSYTDPLDDSKSFTFTNCQIDVQGTSSQYYARKNYKMKFNGGFTDTSGSTSSKYKMRDDSIAVKTFCMKADVASSEGANNVELVRLYESACPYKTPAQIENSKVRQGIDGFPMVIFWNNPDTNETVFLGKYNFNNDKSTEEVFGFVEGDESWEIRNNTNNRVLWRSDDYESMGLDEDGNVVPAWTLDFEARFPDVDPPYQDGTQLKELATFLKSTDPSQATNASLGQTITYPSRIATTVRIDDPVTGAISYVEAYENVNIDYTTDSADYRRAKFKNEIGNYVELQSALFYYLFTELFLMVDSRAKNAFPSFMGTVIGGNENE